MKQILIAVVLFAILVTSVMAEECVPTCNGDQIVVYRVDGRTDYYCNADWSYITLDLMKVLRIKTSDRKRDYPVSNIIYVDFPVDSIPFTRNK
jgi:hypothetical protein